MFMVLHHDSESLQVFPVRAMNAEQRQVVADLWTKPTDFSNRPACRQHVITSTIAIYYYSSRNLILILPSCRG